MRVTVDVVDFRSCPRCQGDVHLNNDMYGDYRQCLQCGHTVDIPKKVKRRFNWAKSREKPGRKRKAA